MCVFPVGLYVHTYTSGPHKDQKREFGPGTGGMGDCEPLCQGCMNVVWFGLV